MVEPDRGGLLAAGPSGHERRRFAPRPEVLSLLGVAIYLTVLSRADGTPELAWALPLVQVAWVNTHGLFVLGPMILGAYMAERLFGSSLRLKGAARRIGRPGNAGGFMSVVPRRWSASPAW